jgi:hypothetical protein
MADESKKNTTCPRAVSDPVGAAILEMAGGEAMQHQR